MGQKSATLTLYSIGHALIDFLSVATLFQSISLDASLSRELAGVLILFYDLAAFALQPLFGMLVDLRRWQRSIAIVGCLLVASGFLWMDTPFLAVTFVGVGNAMYHVGGAVAALRITPGKAGPAGAFVAPGTLGLCAGIVCGPIIGFPLGLLALAVLLLAFLIHCNGERGQVSDEEMVTKAVKFSPMLANNLVLLVLVAVGLRSVIGNLAGFTWKSNPLTETLLTYGALVFGAEFLGKLFGGYIADRFGWARTLTLAMILATVLLPLGFLVDDEAGVLAGLFGVSMFNIAMPITLIVVVNLLPGREGFAFGLTAFVLIAAALPWFMGMVPPAKYPAVPLALVTGAATLLLWWCLRRYNKITT